MAASLNISSHQSLLLNDLYRLRGNAHADLLNLSLVLLKPLMSIAPEFVCYAPVQPQLSDRQGIEPC